MGGERGNINLSTRPRASFWLSALAVLGAGLLHAPGEAQAAGRPVAWGCGGSYLWGQCSVPDGLNGVTAVAAGETHSMALKSDGTVVSWGCGYYLQCTVPSGLSGVTAIAVGNYHSLTLKGDGAVVAWGCGAPGYNSGQCDVPSGLAGVSAIAAGASHSLALKGDGTVVAWGCGYDSGQCSVPPGLNGVTAIAAGTSHSLALKGDGTVVDWGCAGSSNYGQCSVPSDLAGVTAIAADQAQSLALKGDGTVVSWGCSFLFTFGQCGVPIGLAGATAIAAGYYHSLALKADGTVVAWGCGSGFDSGQCSPPSGLSRVSAIAAGEHHSLALIELTDQAITFDPIPNKTYGGDPDFTANATASSGLPISFAANGSCSVNGATVHLRVAGFCTVTASQPGDASYNAAADVSRSFAIATAPVAPPPVPRPPVTPAPPVSARCRVPNVVGKRIGSAKRTIAGRHCRTGMVGYAHSRKRKKGVVISQSRRPGRLLPARSKINLVVSRGRTR